MFFRANYTTPMSRTLENVSQARRCPGYIDYFRASPLMKDHPGKTPIPPGSHCRAAVELHKKLQLKNQKDEKQTRKKI